MCARISSARKIALIGGTGFIGRHLATRLLARGDKVLALVRPDSPRRNQLPAGVDLRVLPFDAKDTRLTAELATADAVIYAAGSVRGRTLADFLPANVHALSAVTGALANLPSPRPLILLSSLAATAPHLSDYARSKRLGEDVLTALPHSAWTILRPTAVYGPGDRELRPLLALMRRGWLLCPAGPEQRLSFIHVEDLTRAVFATLDHPAAVAGGTYALDDGTVGGYGRQALAASLRPENRMRCVQVPRFTLELAGWMNLHAARLFGYAPMLTPGKVGELTHPSWLGDNRPFTRATGWTPQHNLATGVPDLFARP